MVARGAGAAGPVLLACRQWDPLGLARRLPSLGVGAWRCAPLLPWRAQCPVCVCAALAAGSGGFGPAPGVVSLSFPPPRPACSALRVAGRPVRVSLTLARWYAIPCGLWVPRARSGCPSGSPRVSLSCVCARALAVSAPPPRWVVWRAHLAWSRHWALVGPFHVVRAPPRVLPRSLAPSGVLGGGCGPVPVPPYLAWGCGGGGRASPGGCLRPLRGASGVLRSSSPDCPSTGWAVGVRVVGAGVRVWGPCSVPVGAARRGAGPWRSYAGGRAGGGGGGCAVSSGCAAGAGPVGRGVALPRSVPLPSLGRQQSGRHWCCAVHGGRGPADHSGSCSPGFSGYDLCGVPVRRRGPACSSRPPCEPAAGAGGQVTLRLPSRAGGAHPPCLKGWGPGPPRLAGWWEGGGGGCRAAASLLSLRAAACGTSFWPSPCRRRAPFRRASAVGAEVPPRGAGG